ncbi:MAG: DUF6036 family nucleotidyltransferase [Gemmatimonadales bacterium]
MREIVDKDRVDRFMQEVGRAARRHVRIYLVGGTTAVLFGWRATTIDLDLVMRPEDETILRAILSLKETLHLNVELASPADFIPVPEGWEGRSTYITTVGKVSFYHYDLYAQAVAKVERGHQQDLADVQEMLSRGLIDAAKAREYFDRLAPELYRFPSIHAPSFREAVEEVFGAADNADERGYE